MPQNLEMPLLTDEVLKRLTGPNIVYGKAVARAQRDQDAEWARERYAALVEALQLSLDAQEEPMNRVLSLIPETNAIACTQHETILHRAMVLGFNPVGEVDLEQWLEVEAATRGKAALAALKEKNHASQTTL